MSQTQSSPLSSEDKSRFTALIFKETALTYSELEAKSNQVAHALAGIGVRKYDRVALLAHNTCDHVLTGLACCGIPNLTNTTCPT